MTEVALAFRLPGWILPASPRCPCSPRNVLPPSSAFSRTPLSLGEFAFEATTLGELDLFNADQQHFDAFSGTGLKESLGPFCFPS
ncbi:MAG: hypothetical protein KDN18_15240 [Verrucomicrobiae bacterium]|nr:hypothetical protein [Verrucomicrobiae bacterium]